MFKKNIFNGFLKEKWYWYFSDKSLYKKLDVLYDVPKVVFQDFLEFLIETYREDVEFNYLYDEYLIYVCSKKDDGFEKQYLSKKVFEKFLFIVDLKTYISTNDDYESCKYVCFNSNLEKEFF